MGAGASASRESDYEVAPSNNQDNPTIDWNVAAAAAETSAVAAATTAAATATATATNSKLTDSGSDDLSVAHETVQMIFDILHQNGSHMTDEDSMDTVLQTARALANHSHAAALLMSTQRDTASGDTLLHTAVRVSELAVVKLLLTDQFRCDINAQNWKGAAPLHIACTSGSNSAGIAEVLLEWNAWTEIQDVEGCTPLILSAAAGDDECIKTLLKFHASTETRDFNGYSALDWARHYCHASSAMELGGDIMNPWIQYWDESNQLPYWYNTGSGESVWHNPTETWSDADMSLSHGTTNDTKVGPEYNSPNTGAHENKMEEEREEKEEKNNENNETTTPTSATGTPTEKWRNVAWKVGRQRIASKSNVQTLARSPSRRTLNSPAPPSTPKPHRTPTSSPVRQLSPLGKQFSSPMSHSKSPNHGAQIHRQIEMLMKMQADMQEEMRRRLDAAQINPTNGTTAFDQKPGLAAMEKERVLELESQLRAKDDELAEIRKKQEIKEMKEGEESEERGEREERGGDRREQNETGGASSSSTIMTSDNTDSGMSAAEHEAMLLEARKEVEMELSKQRASAEHAAKREKEAQEKEREAMKKVEAMMAELKSKETAINKSRKALADKDADKVETKKALLLQAEQLMEAKNLAGQHQKALQNMRRQHSTVQKELMVAKEQALRQKQMEQQRKDMENQMKRMKEENERLRQDFEKEHSHRRKLLNEVETLKGSIRVLCRIRPMSTTEKSNGHENAISFPPRNKGALIVKTTKGTTKGKDKFYEFDTTFEPNSTQEQVAAQVMPLVQSAIDGFNVCIFAYGQTGSGKTFTMTGADGGRLNKTESHLYGITPRSIVELFNISQASGHHEITFFFSMVELYRGELLDLFREKNNKKKRSNSDSQSKNKDKENSANTQGNNTKKMKQENTKLSVKRDPTTGVVKIENVTKVEVDTPEVLHELIRKGNASRHTATTKMNDTSSRSHLVMTIYCESKNTTSGVTTSGKLNLVDLAGSERQSKTGASGAVFEESKSINKSLSVRFFFLLMLSSR